MPVEAWAIWFGLFVVLEVAAVLMGGGTLTHYIKRFGSIKGERLKWKIPRWALALILAYLSLHFFDLVP